MELAQKSKQRELKRPAEAKTASAVSIADAKATFSSLITRVETRRLPITILRRGVPVAQITPIEQPTFASGYGWMRGTVQELGDIIGPTGVEWEAGDE